MARKGRTKVIYKGTFVSKQSLFVGFVMDNFYSGEDIDFDFG